MGRLEHLLMRVHDGVATPAEREEFEAMGGADATRAWDSMRAQLVAAVHGSVDVADDVMDLLQEPDFAGELRAAVSAPIDVADAVMDGIGDLAAMDCMAFADGEGDPSLRAERANRFLRDPAARAAMANQDGLGAELRDAVAAGAEVDLWSTIAGHIGADPGSDELPGWDRTAAALRAAVDARRPIDVADAVMGRIAPPVRRRMPAWASFGVPVGLMAAAAAALIAILLPAPTEQGEFTADIRQTVGLNLLLAPLNDAQVEDIQTAENTVAQVVRFDDGGPTFIILDDGVASDVGAPGAPL